MAPEHLGRWGASPPMLTQASLHWTAPLIASCSFGVPGSNQEDGYLEARAGRPAEEWPARPITDRARPEFMP